MGRLRSKFLAFEFALRGGHAELDRLGKRGGIGVLLGGLKQLLGMRVTTLADVFTVLV